MKPTFVIYGNCQAGVIREAVRFMPGISDEFEVVYFRSFNHPTEGRGRIDPEIMGRCLLLWEQLDESAPFKFEGATPEQMKWVKFPPVDLGVLWPFSAQDPLFGPEPDYEYGMFPYGDRILIEVSQHSESVEAAILRANELVGQQVGQLLRYLDIELARLLRREQSAHVKIAEFVISTFNSDRLFWAYNHPTKILFRELVNRLAAATWPDSEHLGSVGDTIFHEWEPLAHLHTPIHPAVASKLGLVWWREDLRYRFHQDKELTFDEYVELYLRERMCRLRRPD